jgi:hypothetical protein
MTTQVSTQHYDKNVGIGMGWTDNLMPRKGTAVSDMERLRLSV